MITFPKPLRPGDWIAVTAPSSGVEGGAVPRLGHQPPQFTLVNGAFAEVQFERGGGQISQVAGVLAEP